MFQTDKDYYVDSIRREVSSAEKNYVIQNNDYIGIQVYSNGGERLIDPDNELVSSSGSAAAGKTTQEPPRFLIKVDGTVELPMIGNVKLAGFSLYQADSILTTQYVKYYKTPFVITKLLNRRVVVLGPLSGTGGVSFAGKVIPLEYENMNLVEVLALFGGITDRGKSYNIRIIRGDLKNPDVSIVDLSTIEGMKKANLAVRPNDIIYVESTRRRVTDALRDLTPIITVFSSLLLTVIVLLKK